MTSLNFDNIERIWARHKIVILWSIALVALLFSVVSIGWDVVQFNKTRSLNQQPQNIQPISLTRAPSYNVNDIVSANLFGDPTPKTTVKNAPKTTLNLKLEGVLWSTEDSLARAIIKAGNQKSGLYSVGENIKGAGASVEEIRDNEILLNRSGAIESLPLIKKTTSGNTPLISYTQNYEMVEPVPGFDELQIEEQIQRSSTKPQSPNGEPRKIRKPNFSGLDRALQKMGEI